MHSQKIVHRDLKPANILMQDAKPLNPRHPRIKVADFGFAKHFGKNDETLDYNLGSARYMAPEFFNSRSKNNKDETIDIWAIGCIAFEIFASSEAFN